MNVVPQPNPDSQAGPNRHPPGDATSIRAFVAIPFPVEARARLGAVQRELRELLLPKSVSWVKPDNLHLTLRFLGGIEREKLAEVSRRLRESLAGFGGVNLVCERLGCFPDLRFPRVIWAWAHDEGDRLEQLFRRVNEAVGEFAPQPAEQRFVGHVTIGRPKRISRAEAGRIAKFVENAVGRRFGAWRADSVGLLRSELSPEGSRYTMLDEFRL